MKYVLAWILVGLISGVYLTYRDWKNGIDFTLDTLVVGSFFAAVFGPILIPFLLYLESSKKVLVKGKKQ